MCTLGQHRHCLFPNPCIRTPPKKYVADAPVFACVPPVCFRACVASSDDPVFHAESEERMREMVEAFGMVGDTGARTVPPHSERPCWVWLGGTCAAHAELPRN
jgi:hypothetical protein